VTTTGRDVAAVARKMCAEFAAGNRGGLTIGKIHFELSDISMCSEFVRECSEAAAGTGDHGELSDRYFGTNARHTERKLKAAGKQIPKSKARAGDIVCFNGPGAGHYGHIGLWADDGHTVAENTSSSSRGPGFVTGPLTAGLARRISGTYRIFEPGDEEEARPFRVSLLGTYLEEDAAELRADGTTWVRLADAAQVLGLRTYWRPTTNKVFVKGGGS